MAIDTAAKRFSAANVLSPWRGLNYFPTGSVPQAERQAVIYLYSGILAVAPVSVPNVVGETQAAATTDITNAGLVLGTVSTQYSASVAAGLVISQNPAAGTLVSLGSSVSIVVSLGPQPVLAESPAGSPRRVRTIYRVTIDGEVFERKSLAEAFALLDKAKAAAAEVARRATREATEKQRRTPVKVEAPKLEPPVIEFSSRELRGVAAQTKREIAEIYRKATADIEAALLAELQTRASREKDEEIIWFM